MAIKVQMRGGTHQEHMDFIGLSREVTVDTDDKTLVVHDGVTPGGYPLVNRESFDGYAQNMEIRLQTIVDSIPSEQNYDDVYSKLNHTHGNYVEKINSRKSVFTSTSEGYEGLSINGTDDKSYVRTTELGILPYKSGGYSNIGSTSWRFAGGFFSAINSLTATLKDLIVTSGVIALGFKSRIVHDESTGNYDFFADNLIGKSRVRTGSIELNGKRIYIGSSFPSDARENDILIQI